MVALAPAGGWAEDDETFRETLAFQLTLQEQVEQAAPFADQIVATPEGRRRVPLETGELILGFHRTVS